MALFLMKKHVANIIIPKLIELLSSFTAVIPIFPALNAMRRAAVALLAFGPKKILTKKRFFAVLAGMS
jgi:hypothetical protein